MSGSGFWRRCECVYMWQYMASKHVAATFFGNCRHCSYLLQAVRISWCSTRLWWIEKNNNAVFSCFCINFISALVINWQMCIKMTLNRNVVATSMPKPPRNTPLRPYLPPPPPLRHTCPVTIHHWWLLVVTTAQSASLVVLSAERRRHTEPGPVRQRGRGHVTPAARAGVADGSFGRSSDRYSL